MGKTLAKMGTKAVGRVTGRPGERAKARVKGVVTTKCFRGGELLWEDTSKNIVFDAGLDYLIGVALGAAGRNRPGPL